MATTIRKPWRVAYTSYTYSYNTIHNSEADSSHDTITTETEIMTKLRVKGKKSLYPFQKGIIISNISLKLLFQELQRRFDSKYLMTYRLNQDIIENFFGVVRAKGGLHDHPDPIEFRYRLRSYLLGQNEGSLSVDCNSAIDDTPDLPIETINLSCEILAPLEVENTVEPDLQPDLEQSILKNEIAYDGLENFAGFLCHKLNELSSTISNNTSASSSFTWIDHLSEGGLSKPSEQLMGVMEKLEKVFQSINGDGLHISKNYLKTMLANRITISN